MSIYKKLLEDILELKPGQSLVLDYADGEQDEARMGVVAIRALCRRSGLNPNKYRFRGPFVDDPLKIIIEAIPRSQWLTEAQRLARIGNSAKMRAAKRKKRGKPTFKIFKKG